ncbi:MAG: hypothetical protein KDA75_19425, partial [Planctomycetaceae bacterium]|nr:hypothetical protein [Planctomycetaceae bacterium]
MPNNAFIAAVAAAAGTYLLHSTLLVALVWLMTRRLRARNFALQERLWQLALLGPLLTVAVQSLWPGAAPVAEWRWGTSATEPESTWRMAVTPTHASPVEIPDIAIAALSRSPQTINGTSTDALEHMRDNRPPMPALPRRYSATAPNRDALQVAVPDLSEPWVVTIVPGDVPADSTAATIVASVPEATPSAAEVQLVPGLASETPDAPIGETPNAPRAASTSFTGPLVWLGIAVLGGMLTGLVRLLVHTHTIRRWTRRCRVIDSGPARHLLDQWLMKTSYRRPVRLMTSDAASEPGAWGIVRPTILIPQALESTLTRDELRSLLAHELAHLLRRDPLWLWIGRSIREVCWWQPLNRVALHSWRQCAEHLCDDWTVEQGVSAV